MFKTLTPLLGMLIAVGLFFAYIRPTFGEIRAIQADAAQYTEAVAKAAELRERIAALSAERSAIALSDLERLTAFIPERVEDVRVLIDLDALARTHSLVLGDIKVDTAEDSVNDADVSPGTPALRERAEYAAHDITFSVTGVYEDFRSFLHDLERSLAFMEVTEISFESSEGDAVAFTVGVRLYSLLPPASS